MKYLIDTHTFLWFVSGSFELSNTAKDNIENPMNQVFISIASLWEISIKTSIGKLQIIGEYETVIDDVTENNISILPISFAHTVIQNKLPFYHKDPFDRIIVAQTISEQMSFISCDEIFDAYLQTERVDRIW